jgi:TonB family protein
MTANGFFLAGLAGLSLAAGLTACAAPNPRPVRKPPAAPRPDRDPVASAAPPPEILPVVHLPPPPSDQIIKVRGQRVLLKRGRIMSDLNRPPYRPQIPERWRRRGNVHQGTYKVCVTSGGTVSSVSTLKSAGHRALDGSLREAIGNWRYHPTRIGKRPVAFCYSLGIRVTYTAQTCGSNPVDPKAGCDSTDS